MPVPSPPAPFIDPLERLGLPYCVTGSVAASVYGQPRLTADIDSVLLLKLADMAALRAAFPESVYYVPPEETLRLQLARESRGMFNLIRHATQFKAGQSAWGFKANGAERSRQPAARDSAVVHLDMRCALALCLAVSACASMTESECRGADWAALGERDGIAGNAPRIEVYAYQCGRHKVAAAEKDYLDGWWLGHAEYVRRADSMEGAQ